MYIEKNIGKITYSNIREFIQRESLNDSHIIYLNPLALFNLLQEFKDIYGHDVISPCRILGVEITMELDLLPDRIYYKVIR